MCRLYGFRSSVFSGVHQSLVAAENALARQSVRHPDGWGVAYFLGNYPHTIRHDKTALEDKLFKDVSAVVSTQTLVAHVRQATIGDVNILNCHPFQHGPWVFAHNGMVYGYGRDDDVTEALREAVDLRFRRHVLGTTDSEICFHLFLSRLARQVDDIYHEGVVFEVALAALRETVKTIKEIVPHRGDDPAHRLTFLLTNGKMLLAYKEERPLFFSTYKTECPEKDTCPAYEAYRCERAVTDGIVKHLIVTSEQISEGPNVWVEMGDGDYVGVDFGMNLKRGRLLY